MLDYFCIASRYLTPETLSARVVSTNSPPKSPSELYLYLVEIISTQLLFSVATIFGMLIVITINKRQILKWNLMNSKI
jgi:hypothetical protein